MLEYINKRNNIDINHKFQFNHPLNKVKLKKISVNTNHNGLIKKPWDIYKLYYIQYLWLNQKPKLKLAKKPIAVFNLREKDLIGTKTIFRSNKNKYGSINQFYMKLIYYLLPNLKLGNKVINGKYNYIISYGIEDLNIILEKWIDNIGGGNIQLEVKTPVKYLPMYYLKIK